MLTKAYLVDRWQKIKFAWNVTSKGKKAGIIFLIVSLFALPLSIFLALGPVKLFSRASSYPITPPITPPYTTPTPIPTSNKNPIITTTSLKDAILNSNYVQSVTGTDPDGDVMSMTVSYLPTGLKMGSCTKGKLTNGTSTISCSITGKATKLGSNEVLFVISDGRGGSNKKVLNLSVIRIVRTVD